MTLVILKYAFSWILIIVGGIRDAIHAAAKIGSVKKFKEMKSASAKDVLSMPVFRIQVKTYPLHRPIWERFMKGDLELSLSELKTDFKMFLKEMMIEAVRESLQDSKKAETKLDWEFEL